MAYPANEFSGQSTRASPMQRLAEARWLLFSVGLVFIYFSTVWPDSGLRLMLAYGFILAVAAFSRRKVPTLVRVPDEEIREHPRRIWPETQVKLFVNALPEPSIVLDGRGIVRHTNAPMRDVFGTIVQGEPLTLKFRDPDIVAALKKAQESSGPVSVMHRVRFPTERHYLAYFSPITLPRGNETRPATVLSQAGETGPDFIFVVMLEQTERFRLDELRSDFIANVSHELRTPIASLTGFIETLLGPARDDEESREKFLKIMLAQAQRMARLVNDLLSLSRIEMRSHVRPTDRVDLRAVIGHVVDALSPLASDAGLKISVDMATQPLVVLGDRDELLQVVQNLVENACKYGSDGDKIDIAVKPSGPPAGFDAKGGEYFRIDVRDYGKGIASEHLPRLTERFYRVDADESKRKVGTGLGLAVVKHILTRHHAHMKVTSKPGKGAQFSVYIRAIDQTDKK